MTWRPSGFRLGKMRERIKVQRIVETQNDYGDRQEKLEDVLCSEPATYLQVRGGETIRGRTIDSGIDALFEIHYYDKILPQMQVLFGGEAYGIVESRPVEGGRRYLELYCKKVVANEECRHA